MDIQKYLQIDLVQELGLMNLPIENQMSTLDKISDVLWEVIMTRIIMELDNPQDQEEFVQIVKQSKLGEDDGVYNFLIAKVQNLESIVQQEVASFKKDTMKFLQVLDKHKNT